MTTTEITGSEKQIAWAIKIREDLATDWQMATTDAWREQYAQAQLVKLAADDSEATIEFQRRRAAGVQLPSDSAVKLAADLLAQAPVEMQAALDKIFSETDSKVWIETYRYDAKPYGAAKLVYRVASEIAQANR